MCVGGICVCEEGVRCGGCSGCVFNRVSDVGRRRNL